MTDPARRSICRNSPAKRGQRRKVKTGCRTCKIRKVKCDEKWPACCTCVSTGRVCDGYGIWGGGGNRYEQRLSREAVPKPAKLVSTNLLLRNSSLSQTVPVESVEEHLHFEYFKHETLSKLPGVYGRKYNNIWELLVMQACENEPAVFHAVLAISSAHRRKVTNGISRSRVRACPDKEEKFLLRNYCKSIEYLQPRYHVYGEDSLRIALITCLVFIYLEFLRGNYKGGCDHLNGGLKLLESLEYELKSRKNWARVSSASAPLRNGQRGIESFLIEAFSRLRVQTTFCNRRCETGSVNIYRLSSNLPVNKFGSYNEARHYLDRIFDGVTHLTEMMRNGTHTTWPMDYWEMVKADNLLMQGALDSWLWSYNATMKDGFVLGKAEDATLYEILRVYHTMAEIMAGTCLSTDQLVFDKYESKFHDIVIRSKEITLERNPSVDPAEGNDSCPDPCRRAWPDVGWIPPLYYTALKCRLRDIRCQAVELMSLFWHYEIIRDLDMLEMASLVATEVIRMEESNTFPVKDHQGYEEPRIRAPEAYRIPSLPRERRFDTVEMVRAGHVPECIQMVCKRSVDRRTETTRKFYDREIEMWVEI